MPTIKDFKIDELTGLYFKITKPAKIYSSVYPKPVEWKGWVMSKGSIAGKLFSWVDTAQPNYGTPINQGLFLQFRLRDDFVNGKFYYIKVEPQMLDWVFINNQVDAVRRSKMSWYQRYYDDLETAITDYYEDVKNNAVKGFKMAGGLLLAYGLWEFVIKPEIQVRRIERVVKSAAREFKK